MSSTENPNFNVDHLGTAAALIFYLGTYVLQQGRKFASLTLGPLVLVMLWLMIPLGDVTTALVSYIVYTLLSALFFIEVYTLCIPRVAQGAYFAILLACIFLSMTYCALLR